MDDPEQAQAYANADFAEVNEGFVAAFRAHFPEVVDGHIVDLGAGPADIPRRLALVLPALRITAVDASKAMLDAGRPALARDGVSDRVSLVHGRLPSALAPGVSFSGAISNSLLHHLEDPMVLWRTLVEHLSPGAPVYVMDLRRPQSASLARAIVDTYASGEPDILRRDFLHSLHAAYRPDEVRAQLMHVGLSSLAISEPSDRHLLVHGVMPG